MRLALIAAASGCVLLAACGASGSQNAGNAQAGTDKPVDANSSAPTNATAMVVPGPVSGAEAMKVMHERHEGMETIGKANKAIKRELDGPSPNLATVRASAAQIADLSQKASGWFQAGSGPEIGKTGAKPEIWSPENKADFATKLAAFQKSAKTFNAAAAGGDVNAVKSGFADLGQTCKACHDKYRSEMHH